MQSNQANPYTIIIKETNEP